MAKTKSKKKKIRKIIIFILVLLVAGGLIYYALSKSTSTSKPKKAKIVDKIDNFDYKIDENDTKLLKNEFKTLKSILSKKEVDKEEYAKEVAKLFIIDFFTLDNKMTKNDVGGVQFVFNGYRKTFIDKARDEFYKYVKSNLNNDRTQELPIVKSIEVNSIEKIEASSELNGDTFAGIDEAYKVNVSWDYEKDLGYQKSATLIVVKDNDKLSVAKLTSN